MTTYQTKHVTDYGTFEISEVHKGAITYRTFSYDGVYGTIQANTMNGLVIGLTKAGFIVPISDMRVLLDMAY